MAFLKSAANGLLIKVPDQAVMLKLPRAYRTEQNGHLFVRDKISADVLVQATVLGPSSADEFKGIPSEQASDLLNAAPEETRLEAKAKTVESASKSKKPPEVELTDEDLA